MMLAAIDTTALWETVVASLVAGVGTTTIFSVAILGFVRASDATRSGRTVEAALFSVLALVGVIATAAAVVLAVVVMTTK